MPELYFQDFPGTSDNPPLVLLHGLFGSGTNWRGVARKFEGGRRVLALDMRNHGRSFNDPEMTYPAMARDVLDTLDGLGIERADILGHSMGGKAAMILALDHPERLHSLVVVDIAPVAYDHTQLPLVEAMMRLDLAAVRSRKEADEALAPSVPDRAVRQFLLQSLEQADGDFRWRLNLEALKRAMDDLVGFPDPGGRTFDGSTLFVNGSESDYVLPSYRPRIERYFPNVQYARVEKAGHWVHADQPAALIHEVGSFLSGTRSPG